LPRCASDLGPHSFPTRRSSDLRAKPALGTADQPRSLSDCCIDARADRISERAVAAPNCEKSPSLRGFVHGIRVALSLRMLNVLKIGRAHVELQSPCNLVCRLLL